MKTFRQFCENDDDWHPTHTGWHGTPDARGIHKDGFRTLKQRYGHEDEHAIHWAAADHKTAKSYAKDHRAFDYQNAEPAVLPVELRMKNPKVIHWGGKTFRGKDPKTGERHAIEDHISQARKDGHDGFVVHKIRDNYEGNEKSKPGTIMGVFDHKNIRVKK